MRRLFVRCYRKVVREISSTLCKLLSQRLWHQQAHDFVYHANVLLAQITTHLGERELLGCYRVTQLHESCITSKEFSLVDV